MTDGWFRNERGNLVKRYGPPPTPVARGDFPTPRVITDTMPLAQHVDGKHYDSKSAFRAVTKANGLTEVGNEKMPPAKPAKADPSARHASIRKAMAQAGL